MMKNKETDCVKVDFENVYYKGHPVIHSLRERDSSDNDKIWDMQREEAE